MAIKEYEFKVAAPPTDITMHRAQGRAHKQSANGSVTVMARRDKWWFVNKPLDLPSHGRVEGSRIQGVYKKTYSRRFRHFTGLFDNILRYEPVNKKTLFCI